MAITKFTKVGRLVLFCFVTKDKTKGLPAKAGLFFVKSPSQPPQKGGEWRKN